MTVLNVRCDADYLHTMELPNLVPLVLFDFTYVKPDVIDDERGELLGPINEHGDTFLPNWGVHR